MHLPVEKNTQDVILWVVEVLHMILIDRDIRERVQKGELIIEGFNNNNVNSISYDLSIDKIIDGDDLVESYELAPNEFIFIQSSEVLSLPNDIMGRVALKNSRMRLGLDVAPLHYHPGHTTKAYIRVSNISPNGILLKSGDKIAQIIFEQLTGIPETPYNSTFQNEMDYRGYGGYQTEYEKRICKINEAKENLEQKEQQIYSNILTFMGIFVAIFSIISINFQAFSQAELNTKFILTMNSSLCFCITVMLGIVLLFLNKAKNKGFVILYSIILGLLGVTTVALCLFL